MKAVKAKPLSKNTKEAEVKFASNGGESKARSQEAVPQKQKKVKKES